MLSAFLGTYPHPSIIGRYPAAVDGVIRREARAVEESIIYFEARQE